MCEHITKLIEQEKAVETRQKIRQDKRRKQTLFSLHHRHEANYQLEMKAGIKKPLYSATSRPQTAGNGEIAVPFKFGFAVDPIKKLADYPDSQAVGRLKVPKRVLRESL